MTAHSWDQVRARVEGHGDRWRPLMRLLDWIRDEGLEEEVFAHTSMFDVVLAAQARYRDGENTLRLSWDPTRKKMAFRYDRLYASTDTMIKEVSEEVAIETLREFLAYKFGVYRQKKEPNQPPEPMSGLAPGHGSS